MGSGNNVSSNNSTCSSSSSGNTKVGGRYGRHSVNNNSNVASATINKSKKYGQTVDNVYACRLRSHQSIASHLAQISDECVALERYADGTLFFSGPITPASMALLGAVPKRGWRPEVRRSRTLSLLVKGANDANVPRMTAEDAVDVVRHSCLWENIHNVELIRVANTNGRSAHVFLQYEGEQMARSQLNKVDAMPYTHRESQQACFVHGSQLNTYFEYEPQAGSCDPTVWWNRTYVGHRTITITMQSEKKRANACTVEDALIRETVEQVLGTLYGSVEIIRRVEMISNKTCIVVQMRSVQTADAAYNACSNLKKVTVRSVNGSRMKFSLDARLKSRRGDNEVSDRIIWDSAESNASSSDEMDVVSTTSSPGHRSASLPGLTPESSVYSIALGVAGTPATEHDVQTDVPTTSCDKGTVARVLTAAALVLPASPIEGVEGTTVKVSQSATGHTLYEDGLYLYFFA